MNNFEKYVHRFDEIDGFKPFEIPWKTESDVKSKKEELFDFIFSADPVTGVPQGDLAIYLGDKANPEIKAFIQNELMSERSDSSDGMNLPDEVINKFRSLSDDDVALFSRNHNESREEYANRLRLYFAKERADRVAKAKQREYDSLVEKLKNGY